MRDQQHRDPPTSGFSRRAFLKGSGAAAAATALAQGPQIALAQDDKVQAKGWKTIELNVNGKSQKVKVENRTTLLEALRYGLNLTGCKPISTDGASCGGSTVLMDGKPITAGSTLAVACVGKKIQTVESLGGAKPDAVPVAFVEHDAMQCGFGTPGFVMGVRAFLDKHPNATEEGFKNAYTCLTK